MSNDEMRNIPTLSAEKTVKQLSDAYSAVINGGMAPSVLPSVMLWGAPGIGKSQAVRQAAEHIEKNTGKRVVVTDVRLLLFNPIDLRGIPTANEDKTLAIWLKPQIFRMDGSDGVVNILFLDEISAAPQSVQAAAYQIALDHTVGEHKLPDNCIVIAAGNRVTDKSVAYKMPKALANRLCHIELESNFESWRKWAIAKGINEKVIGFLSARNDLLMGFDASRDELAFSTPRSWEMVSRLMNCTGMSMEKLYPLIAGCIGSGVAAEFRTWCRVYGSLPATEDIFKGKVATVPTDTDALYALISSMTVYAGEHRDDMAGMANSIRYGMKMPADFSTVLMKNYMAIEDGYREKLMRIPEFMAWAKTKGRLLNGSV
ncbi:MAG: AAA family ATPase [Clostridia bacterium]|nr:AAA family ATPase [Clostridia bacterium]